MKTVNQARQIDDLLLQQTLLVPPGGSQFMLVGAGVLERETDGYAALAAGFVGAPGAPFSVMVYQYPGPGALAGEYNKNSAADPALGLEVVNLTRPITQKYLAIEVIDTGGIGGLVICTAKLRPISCYDMEVEVVFDPGDVLKVRNLLGLNDTVFNGNSGGGDTQMFVANANRLEVVGVNIGPRPIHVTFGPAAAVYGAGQYVRAGGDFRFDRTAKEIRFIDDGGTGGALVSATEFLV